MKEAARWIGGGILMILLLWWVFHDKDPQAVGSALASASIAALVLGAILNFSHNILRAWRWGALLEPVSPGVPVRPMFTAIVVGYLTTWLIPGRLGELVRPVLLAGRARIPAGACLGSVVADRILDGAAIAVLFSLGVAIAPLEGEAARYTDRIRLAAFGLVAILIVGLVVLLAASAARIRLAAWAERRGAAIRWAAHAFLALAEGVEALRRPRLLARVVVQSLMIWLLIDLGTWVGVRASGADVPFSSIMVLMPLLALGVALPTPGGAGGYHLAMAWGLDRLFGVPPATAAGAGILMHLAIVVPVVLVGPVLLRIDKISWEDLLAAAREVRDLGRARQAPPAEVVP